MTAAFSRFNDGQGVSSVLERRDLPNFLRFVVTSMNSAALGQDEIIARSSDLTKRLMDHLPLQKPTLSLTDILQATERILVYPPATTAEEGSERGRLGSKQLRHLRTRLESN